MMPIRLTRLTLAATSWPMQRIGQGAGRSRRSVWSATAVMLVAGSLLPGCISVNAPDKPIVIDLNINIKQEVTYRLAGDAGKTIETNPGIF